MEASGHSVRDSDEQEVRHDHHAVHLPEHADHDAGPLQPVSHVELRAGQPEHGLHRHLHHRVHPQDLRAQAVLLQGAVERLRLCRRRPIHHGLVRKLAFEEILKLSFSWRRIYVIGHFVQKNMA